MVLDSIFIIRALTVWNIIHIVFIESHRLENHKFHDRSSNALAFVTKCWISNASIFCPEVSGFDQHLLFAPDGLSSEANTAQNHKFTLQTLTISVLLYFYDLKYSRRVILFFKLMFIIYWLTCRLN